MSGTASAPAIRIQKEPLSSVSNAGVSFSKDDQTLPDPKLRELTPDQVPLRQRRPRRRSTHGVMAEFKKPRLLAEIPPQMAEQPEQVLPVKTSKLKPITRLKTRRSRSVEPNQILLNPKVCTISTGMQYRNVSHFHHRAKLSRAYLLLNQIQMVK